MRTTIRTKSRSQMRAMFLRGSVFVLLLGTFLAARAQEPAAAPAAAPAQTPAQTPSGAQPGVPATDPSAATTPSQPAATDAATPSDAQSPAGTATAAPGSDAATPGASGAPATVKTVDTKATKGHHVPKPKKVKPPPMVPVTIERGVLTVDGWTGKAELNYSIMDLKFIYLWAPGIGTAIVSSEPFPMATLQAGAFNGHTLTVNASGHTIQVASDRDLLSGKELIKPAYVALDTDYVPDHPNYPQFGYGVTSKAPYAWPASMANYTGDVSRAPPLPPSLLPTLKTQTTCPAGSTPTTAAATAAGNKAACTVTPMVMYPGKEPKHEKAESKKDKKANEKLDDSYQ